MLPLNFFPLEKTHQNIDLTEIDLIKKKTLGRDFIFLMRNLEPVKTYGIALHKNSIQHLCLPQGHVDMLFMIPIHPSENLLWWYGKKSHIALAAV